MSTWLFPALLTILSTAAPAAQEPPVIKAHSPIVTVTDGLHVKKNYWYVMPERALDIYYVEIPMLSHTVTFTTDVESLSLPVTFGSRHRFVIRLDGRDALTEVRAEFKKLPSFYANVKAPAIPFTLGDNDKIYVKGRINGGADLNLQFDLGAGGSLVKKASVPKANLTFDGTTTLHNSDGTNVVPSSSANEVEIGGMTWKGVAFAVADNMTHREDGLIGNSLFQDKVLEFDYDKMVIAVHDAVPALSTGWTRHDMILDGVVPFVRGTLAVGDSVRHGWFMLDTGAYTSILNSQDLSSISKFTGEMRRLLPIAGRGRGPELSVGGHTFSDTNYSVRRDDGDPAAIGLLGNDILKRFNLIVDNRTGSCYFKPNARMGDTFRNPERLLVRLLGLAAVTVSVLAVWRTRRRRPRSRNGHPLAADTVGEETL